MVATARLPALALLCQLLPALISASAFAQDTPAPDPSDGAPFELWTIDADGRNARKFLDLPGYTCGSPDWSPDGKRIAFDRWQVGQPLSASEIAIVDSDGGNCRAIGPGAVPSWSPDGKQLACHTYSNPQAVDVMYADGAGRESLINRWGSPRWSPRGNCIASIDGDHQIMLFDLVTGREKSLLPPKYNNSFHYTAEIGFAISPDGTRYCFGSNAGLFLATIPTSSRPATYRWLVKYGAARHAAFAPDGNHVVFGFTPPAQKLEQLYVMNVDTDAPPTPLPGQDPTRTNSCPDWSPNGKTIVYVSQSTLDPNSDPSRRDDRQ
jgi:Tol biopolymer transport system component